MSRTVKARVSAHRIDNTEIPESVIEIEGLVDTAGRRQLRLPEGYVWPAEAMYAQCHVEGDPDPFVIILDTAEEARAAYLVAEGY